MKLDELVQKYGLLLDEEGNYYYYQPANGQKKNIYAPISVLAGILGIYASTISKRIKKIQPLKIKDRRGAIIDAYNLNDVRKSCADLLENLPLADDTGVAILNKQAFAPIKVISRRIGLSADIIKPRIKSLSPVKIKNNGTVLVAYCISEVKLACSDRLQGTPSSNTNGIYVFNGVSYAVLTVLSKLLNLGTETIRTRIKELQPLRVKSRQGKLCDAYSIKDVKTICADLLAELPAANYKGTALINRQQYATLYILAKLLNLSTPTIKKRIRHLRAQKIKDRSGHIQKAYKIRDVKAACADLLIELPHSDGRGIALIHGQKYVPLKVFRGMFGCSRKAIIRRITKLKAAKIKDLKGHVVEAFSLKELTLACADLLAKKQPR